MEPNSYQPPEAESPSTAGLPNVTLHELWQAARQGAKRGAIFGAAFVFGWCVFALLFGSLFAEGTPTAPLPRSLQPSSTFSLASLMRIAGMTITAAAAGVIGGATLGVRNLWSRRKQTART